MATRLLVLMLLLLSSCGREVKVNTTQLENYSGVQNTDALTLDTTGTLTRTTNGDQIMTNGSTYTVSMYSSYLALEFIAAKPIGTQTQVKYKGSARGNQVTLELIQAQ